MPAAGCNDQTGSLVLLERYVHGRQLASICDVVSQRVQVLLKAYFKIKANCEQEKKNPL